MKDTEEAEIVPFRIRKDKSGTTISGDGTYTDEDTKTSAGYKLNLGKKNGSVHVGFGPKNVATIEPGLEYKDERFQGSLSLYFDKNVLSKIKRYTIALGGLIAATGAHEIARDLIDKYSAQLSAEYKIGLPIAAAIVTGLIAGYGINRFFKKKIEPNSTVKF